jgi:hypothetical protein
MRAPVNRSRERAGGASARSRPAGFCHESLLLHPERPLLQGRPSFQVAIDHESGDALVGFRFHPLALQFLFDDELASKLARELSEVIATPRPARLQRTKS